MAVNTTAQFINVDAIELEMTITMPLASWRELAQALPSKFPMWQLSGQITELVRQAERRMVATPPTPPA